jgi:CRISPR/Cas system CSM-associated protein Csm3 (group 7 of RAMP superfamily)
MSNHTYLWKKFDQALVTIELETAFIVAAQDGDTLFDSVFVSDANGLPCIPGDSLAGILRHALADGKDPQTCERCRKVFGFQQHDSGDASKIRVSFAHPHGKDNLPVACRLAKIDDPVLAALAAGVGRDHVRIGGHGAVDERGKFDELLVPAGARFTFEIALSSESGLQVSDILKLLAASSWRIGGRTRSGLGRFKVIQCLSASFDLSNKDSLERLSKLPVALEKAAVSTILKPTKIPTAGPSTTDRTGKIRLKPIGTWVVGGGISTGREPERSKDNSWKSIPLSERRISWSTDRGEVLSEDKTPYLLPASSVKGALRHRTAFHARRLRQEWMGKHEPTTPEEEYLFGEVRGNSVRRDVLGSAGKVYLGDVYINPDIALQSLQHVSLDRFTQGPMDHLLFDELCLGQYSLELEIEIRLPKDDSEDIARQALTAALQDLCEGRLAIGAGRGHGRFKGKIEWPNGNPLRLGEAVKC